jgi:hypothetical protein
MFRQERGYGKQNAALPATAGGRYGIRADTSQPSERSVPEPPLQRTSCPGPAFTKSSPPYPNTASALQAP